MRWLRLAIVAMLVALAAVATASNPATATVQQDFISKLVLGAQENERRTGIPSSVTIGMAALESGWGRSSMAADMTVGGVVYHVNTLFNIKCTSYVSPYQTGCVPVSSLEYRSDGSSYAKVSNFRTYSSWTNSMLDYGRLLTSNDRYARAFNYRQYPDQFVTEVRAGGYATDPKYATLVISIMRSYNLYQYNLSGAGSGYPPALAAPGATVDVDPVFKPGSDYPAFARGSRGLGVETLQALLNARGGAALVVDGSYGEQTQTAVKAFQTATRLSVTGAMDDATWEALLPSLAVGAKGPEVEALQRALKGAGQTLEVTGSFDAATDRSLRAFQNAQRIKPTGKASGVVWARLLA